MGGFPRLGPEDEAERVFFFFSRGDWRKERAVARILATISGVGNGGGFGKQQHRVEVDVNTCNGFFFVVVKGTRRKRGEGDVGSDGILWWMGGLKEWMISRRMQGRAVLVLCTTPRRGRGPDLTTLTAGPRRQAQQQGRGRRLGEPTKGPR